MTHPHLPTILVISGSPRKESKSFRLAKHLYERLNGEMEFSASLLDIREFQLPNFEKGFDTIDSTPAPLKPMAEKFLKADAYIIVTPEYNGSYTAVLQNFFEHFPRQEKKVYGVVTATNGSLGGMRASQQLLLLVIALFGIVSPYMLITPFVDKKFDEDGLLLDHSFQPKIDFFLTQFKWLVKKVSTE